ncbi:TauD/TfdA family dioxygenase [Acinetobacter baumannii]|nr:TauD/TfdA family dioxygenase [Acinetobacter baumannii]
MMDLIYFDNFGAKLKVNDLNDIAIDDIKKILATEGFLLIDDVVLTRESFFDFFSSFGEVVRYIKDKNNPNYVNSDITLLKGEGDDVISGRGELPFHADGDNEEFIVDHLFLYSLETSINLKNGTTGICNHFLANQELPTHLKNIMYNHKHYMKVKDFNSQNNWREIPVFSGKGSSKRMLLYFPFKNYQSAKWECRVEGLNEVEVRKYFNELQDYYRNSKFYYEHHWVKNQMLICDNRKVLHERTPFFESFDQRVLMRGITRE